jgi:vancomycin resistance protein YoaR
LKIKARSPHSRPVPYVPLGRDAAVSFPEPDLSFSNTFETPIAISATVGKGVIEFRILGQKEEDKEIRIVQGGSSAASNGVKYVQDNSLGFGVEKVIESGSSRRTMSTYKVTIKGGQEVARETLNTSVYRGSPRIIARNSKATAPAPKPPVEGSPSLTSSGGSGTSSSPGTPSPQER